MTDTRTATMTERDVLYAVVVPGLGHLMRGWWRKALAFFGLLVLQGITLYLALMRGRLAWVNGSPEYWFSTTMLWILFAVLWLWSVLDLRRSIAALADDSSARGYWQIVSRRFAKDLKGVVGLSIILIVLYVALFAPFLSVGNALKMDLVNFLATPSPKHPLGADNFGRDVLDRIIFGARVALGIGAMATVITMTFGGLLGLIGGYFRGVPDAVIMRFLEIVNSIPFLVRALLVISLWGSSIPTLIVVLGISGLGPARIIRSEVLSVREEDYVISARAVGAGTGRIIWRHVLPNAIASLLVVTTMTIGVNIIVVAGLSFLGFGVKPPTPSWGAMLQQSQEFMRTAWWMAIYPGICIIITVFGFNILGDSLRDVLDPRLK